MVLSPWVVDGHLHIHIVSSHVCLRVQISLFFKHTSHVGLGPHRDDLILTSVTLFPNFSSILRY